MQITRSSIETQKGPAGWFTGDVYIDAIAAPAGTSTVAAAAVHFAIHVNRRRPVRDPEHARPHPESAAASHASSARGTGVASGSTTLAFARRALR